MFKIRDSVDLRELEKIGKRFRKDYDCYVRYYFKVGNAVTLADKKSKIIDFLIVSSKGFRKFTPFAR